MKESPSKWSDWSYWFGLFLKSPTERLCLIIGSIFIFLAFYSFSRTNREWRLEQSAQLNFCFFVIGIGLILITVFMISAKFLSKAKNHKVSLVQIPNGYRIKHSPNLTIDISVGMIEDIKGLGPYGAVVLPANTSFDDVCIRDRRSALGAFFQRHFPEDSKIKAVQQMITNELCKIKQESGGTKDEYVPGTTVFLDNPLGSQHRILVTAVTSTLPEGGIKADTLSLIACLKGVFRISAIHRLSELWMPVLGTGHGGLDFSAALSLILVQSLHCVIHEGGHHIRSIHVIVYDPDNSRKDEIKKVIQGIGQIF